MLPPPPPAGRLSEQPLGTRLVAAYGTAEMIPELDFETYTPAGAVWDADAEKWVGPPGAAQGKRGLDVVGAFNTLVHPEAEILCASYDLKDGLGRRFWYPGMRAPTDLFAHIAGGGLVEAHNSGYERWCWELICVPRLGWPVMPRKQWRCSMAKARAFCLPGGLDKAGELLGLSVTKDKAAKAVAKRFWQPVNPSKKDPRTRIVPAWPGTSEALRRPADVPATVTLGEYNLQDAAAEAEVSARVPDLEGEELAWWQADQEINARGVAVDRPALENCAAILREALERYNGELQALTGIDSASKVAQLLEWMRDRAFPIDALDEENVEAALAGPIHDPQVRRVLEIRAAIGSASVKKVFAMLNVAGYDGRLRDLFIYHGARTGRATGDGPQPTNLPKAGSHTYRCVGCGQHFGLHRAACPHCDRLRAPDAEKHEWSPEIAEQAIVVLASRSLAWVEHVFGDALLTIAGVLRGMFVAAPGHDLISTDYNSIEAIGLAMLAGEQWRIEVFRTHGKIYETSAARMFGLTLDEILDHKKRTGQHHPLRQTGKVAELAFGYQGWLGAAKAFGMPGEDYELKANILNWRAASPAVVHIWGGQTRRVRPGVVVDEPFGTEGMAVRALQEPRREFPVLRLDGTESGLVFEAFGGRLYLTLPSGRRLTYHAPRLSPSDRFGTPFSLSYEGWNTNPKNGPKGWIRMNTWGGRLTENWNQAACRDILRHAVLKLEAAHYPVVLHVYDEIVSEVPEGFGSIDDFERIVTERPAWAHDWPIRAPGGWRAKRYRKG